MAKNRKYLRNKIKHISIETSSISDLVDSFSSMAFQSRNLSNASIIYGKMVEENDCTIMLCLSGSLFSAGLKRIVYDLIQHNMVDVIISTGAIMVDQDFFEGIGFSHYAGTPNANDEDLRRNHIDRIYDTFIDEYELRKCDSTIRNIADGMEPRPYSSREFLIEMGKYLEKHGNRKDSVVLEAYRKGVPIFVPAFSDSSAGFGLVEHQWHNKKAHISIDSVKDFLELTKVKIASKESGLLMIGGGVPKNFAQDTVVAAAVLNEKSPMHKYAVQITVADERDGALSGSTLKEAHSWGKVAAGNTQMVYSEATIAMPIMASYVYQKGTWKNRKPKKYNEMLDA